MKQKLILGLLTAMTAGFTLSNAKANPETGTKFKCLDPMTNTCFVTHFGDKEVTAKGVFTVYQ